MATAPDIASSASRSREAGVSDADVGIPSKAIGSGEIAGW
jgi:hypothetical protein